ncbi:putative glycoprotein [Hubei chuvirus-like virus 3]|uniref:Putative glycoprotein n=1 Tax=Hubei chuvirus-like virus 3 TaxID=1922858 RepID=A0A1L3KN43_9VIRU|nr:putative glycoprotein [Hubei chuvirus-like virus 3]APG78725.1 putative glycoprotein [Hubei chuvirus-like virus 3]
MARLESFERLTWMVVSLLVAIAPQATVSSGMIGFDCGHRSINVSTIALDKVPDCQMNSRSASQKKVTIQLIQLADSYPVHVYQCKVNILRHITYCGMHSHSSEVRGGLLSYVKIMGKSECESLHKELRMAISHSSIIDGLRPNSTSTHSVTLAGSINSDGKCEGSDYSDLYGSWARVVVSATVTITLSDYTASSDTVNDQIHLRSGLSCKASEGSCMDTEAGYTIWTGTTRTRCDANVHLVLYEGTAMRYTSRSPHEKDVITYMVEDGSRIFGLRITGPYDACSFNAYTTEHPKLIIVPEEKRPFYFQKRPLMVDSMDMMAYVNAKFVYVEKRHERSYNALYKELNQQRCRLERKVLKNMLSIATIDPTAFAYMYMDSPGYTAVTLGEVIHLIQCSPIEVTIRQTPLCYSELPVTWNNESFFLTARSRLIQKYGTETDCDDTLSSRYRIEGVWYSFGEKIKRVSAPTELSPEPGDNIKYEAVEGLATLGIYNYDEAEQLRRKIMNPYERDAITNTLTRGSSMVHFDRQDLSVSGMMDDASIDAIANRYFTRVVGVFSVIGNVSASFLGCYVVLRLMKLVFDTLIHGKAIYEIYGFSLALLGAIWDSATTYLLHRGTRERKQNSRTDIDVETGGEDVQMEEPITPSAPKEEVKEGITPSRGSGSGSKVSDSPPKCYPDLRVETYKFSTP